MSYHSRRILTPGASRKRKEMEAIVSSTSSKPPTAVTRAVSFATSTKGAEQQPLAASNRLLAGYMAYEFLSQGTLFGQKFEPEEKRNRPSQAEPTGKSKPKPQGYTEVANLMKSNRAHIPGIINPTQLVRWIQM